MEILALAAMLLMVATVSAALAYQIGWWNGWEAAKQVRRRVQRDVNSFLGREAHDD